MAGTSAIGKAFFCRLRVGFRLWERPLFAGSTPMPMQRTRSCLACHPSLDRRVLCREQVGHACLTTLAYGYGGFTGSITMRAERSKRQYAQAQSSSTTSRLRKPIRKYTCASSQVSHAG